MLAQDLEASEASQDTSRAVYRLWDDEQVSMAEQARQAWMANLLALCKKNSYKAKCEPEGTGPA